MVILARILNWTEMLKETQLIRRASVELSDH